MPSSSQSIDSDIPGLSEAEQSLIRMKVGREPNPLEWSLFKALWAEHCSYKSSKSRLARLPREGDHVLQGPGENAGAVAIGEGLAAVFKIESHNHPSFVEPYQGAASGVGGILRDVIAMGARPIALLNALRFGSPDHPQTRHFLTHVVAGIGDYGNCMGVPTLGGETGFDDGYNENILVNAMAVGIASRDRLSHARAPGPGHAVFYLGAPTGRDGIEGAVMASQAFSRDHQEQERLTIQVADPFWGKLLMEASLAMIESGMVLAIQDMGAAGLLSSSTEMAAKGGVGVQLELDSIPLRASDMTPMEIMLSESQERMLLLAAPEAEAALQSIADRWGLAWARIGVITERMMLTLSWRGESVADIAVNLLAEGVPEPPHIMARPSQPMPISDIAPPQDSLALMLDLLASPDLSSREWVYQQYDNTVGGDTVRSADAGTAVIRVAPSGRSLALTVDSNSRYVQADPKAGAIQTMCQAWRHLIAVGAHPLAATDNLNFGAPENPVVMRQFDDVIHGLAEAAHVLNMPIVSGNVSFYNETQGCPIPPTPVIGAIGLLDSAEDLPHPGFMNPGHRIILIGEIVGHLGQSLFARLQLGKDDGPPPPVHLDMEKRTGLLVKRLIGDKLVSACRDVGEGGLLIALARMVLAGGLGAVITPPWGQAPLYARLFGEDQGCYIVSTSAADQLLDQACAEDIPAHDIGCVGGDALNIEGIGSCLITHLRQAYQAWLPHYMDPARKRGFHSHSDS